MKRVIFSDIDGTIFSNGLETLSRENIKAINNAKKEKAEFVLNTANGYFLYLKTIAKSLDVNYVIAASGTQIIDVKNDEYILDIRLPIEVSKNIINTLQNKNIPFVAFGSKRIFSNKNKEKGIVDFIKRYFDSEIEIEEPQIDLTYNKIMLISNIKGDVEKYINELPKDNYHLVKSNDFIYEMIPVDSSKGNGILLFAKHFDVNLNNAMSIGDGSLDISMFEVTGYSYSMDNASSEVKNKSKFHAADVNQNGLSYAIDDYLYRSKEVNNG